MTTPRRLSLLLAFAATLGIESARAQFPHSPAADRVVGTGTFHTAGTGAATASGILSPRGIAIDPTSGKLFVADLGHHRILRFPDAATLASGADAEAVIGQVNFSGEFPGTSATKFRSPYGVHVDGSGRLWVADSGNSRVLMFQNASTLGNGAAADLVLGKPDFTTFSSMPGPPSALKMDIPRAVFVDAADNLWVVDLGFSRVLKFAAVSGLANGAPATTVLGQPNFTTAGIYPGGAGMRVPQGVTVDGSGRLWVADTYNHRILRFDNAASLGNGAAASAVLGQANLTSGASGATARNLAYPYDVKTDLSGTLYVSDGENHRVLLFQTAASKANGAAADGVIGQPDFTTNTAGTTDQNLNATEIGLASDGAGHLWITDPGNNRVLRFSPNSATSTLDATLTADLGNDLNGNAQADSGDEIHCTLTLTNPDDDGDAEVLGVFFFLVPPATAPLEVGSAATSQGTVAVGNTADDGSIEIDLGTIADAETATVTFTLKLGYEAASPLLLQGTITSDLPGNLLTDDPALAGVEDATEIAVNFTYRPATFTLARVRPARATAITLSGTATDAVHIEVTRKPSGPGGKGIDWDDVKDWLRRLLP